ncbi:ATP-dependent RNA helicase [Candidatus Sumerlaeota bacterium]|nr:ATP-dependent RNA helicase [Candidatus Sumerlaeota bacterium]
MPALSPLPIDSLLSGITGSLHPGVNAVVVAPPGAGKTSRVPPAILEVAGNKSVILLQPRRVAARAAASRIAQERGWRIGEEVGYQIRFENRTGPRTRLKVVTEGILTRKLASDPYLEDVGCVILDEFHERSIHTDLAIALLREIQSTVRDDLRIVVMSATMNAGPVARFLGAKGQPAPIFESEGRLHPVKIEYLSKPDASSIWERTARAIRPLIAESAEAGHILVFLPGIGEIRRTHEMLKNHIAASGVEIHILHSSISGEDQDRALRPSARRKLILATNIAETSITIDGVRTVVDSGYARVMVNDARVGIDRLELRRISLASAAQRAGRAGRTAPGRCLRLWTPAEEITMEEFEKPEIQRIDLASTILAIRAFGARDPAAFGWFEPPRAENLARAERLLEMLGAIHPKTGITVTGKKIAALPLHPRLGRMLLAGAEQGLLREAATLAAILSETDIFSEGQISDSKRARGKSEARLAGPSDILLRYDALAEASNAEGWNSPAGRQVERVRDELLRLMRPQSKDGRKSSPRDRRPG